MEQKSIFCLDGSAGMQFFKNACICWSAFGKFAKVLIHVEITFNSLSVIYLLIEKLGQLPRREA